MEEEFTTHFIGVDIYEILDHEMYEIDYEQEENSYYPEIGPLI